MMLTYSLRPFIAALAVWALAVADEIAGNNAPIKMPITGINKPNMMLAMIQPIAVFDADCAPAISPCASLLFTFDAYTMDTIPPTTQQKRVVRMAPTM
jgi:hypothetical protein